MTNKIGDSIKQDAAPATAWPGSARGAEGGQCNQDLLLCCFVPGAVAAVGGMNPGSCAYHEKDAASPE